MSFLSAWLTGFHRWRRPPRSAGAVPQEGRYVGGVRVGTADQCTKCKSSCHKTAAAESGAKAANRKLDRPATSVQPPIPHDNAAVASNVPPVQLSLLQQTFQPLPSIVQPQPAKKRSFSMFVPPHICPHYSCCVEGKCSLCVCEECKKNQPSGHRVRKPPQPHTQ